MNKKFSTLVAGILLAGALLTPSELFAKLQYADGKTYEKVDQISKVESGSYYLVTDAGKVISVNADGALVSTSLAGASAENAITLTESKYGFTIKSGSKTLGLKAGRNGASWSNSHDANKEFSVTVKRDKLVISADDYYVNSSLSLTKFSSDLGNVKLVSTDVLTDKVYASGIASDLSASYFLLMSSDNEVVNGAGKLVSYIPTVDQSVYWTVKVAEEAATFVNKETGATLKDAEGNVVSAKLTKSEDGEYTNLGNLQLLVPGGNATIDEEEDFIAALGVVNEYRNDITAADLMSITGSGFQASIKKYVDGNKKDKALANNPFEGILKPVRFKAPGSAELVQASEDATTYMIQNAAGNILVIDLNDKYAAGTGTKYAIKAISPKVLANAIADKNPAISNRYAYNFNIIASEAFVPGQDQNISWIWVSNLTDDYYRLGSVDLSGVPTLAAESDSENFLNSITIKLGQFNTVDVKSLLGKTATFFTVTNKAVKKDSKHYGTVLGLDELADPTYIKKSEALIGYPETQWALTYNEGSNELILTNRENPEATKEINVATIYNTITDHVYAINGDTLEIKPITKYAESDGYLRLNADELRDQQYYVAAASSVYENVAYLVENHKDDHQVGLDTKKENATVWNVATAMYEGLNNLGDRIEYRPDTILVKSVLGYYDADGVYQETKDANGGTTLLKLLAYSFQNSANKEYFAYDKSMNRYATGESGSKTGYTKENAQLFAVKMVAEGKYNLIPVDGSVLTHTTEANSLDAANAAKLYSGDGAVKGILNNTLMYSQTENDLFTIEKKDVPEYRKVAMADTIKIFRDENEAQILFEKGEFLSIANAVQFPNTNPALYVDTAYVDRGSNNRWEYLLAVNAKHWDSKVDCDIPGHPKHEADTTTGRFLVNLMDSAYVYGDNNLHNNKFINEEDGESYAKLGFVEGYHTHDTLYLQRPNGTYAELPMNREDYSHSMAKYAFRYVDQEQGSFVIETGRKDFAAEDEARNVISTGYLKWLNGVVVVVDDIEKADIFNLDTDERTPTSNESTTVSSVSVIPTRGAVIVKGAAGKNVAVSNILGQNIANTVLTSDNATISVPAGIVVVAVEGEEAIKVVVE